MNGIRVVSTFQGSKRQSSADPFKGVNDDGKQHVDQDEGARDGEAKEHDGCSQGVLSDTSKLELVQKHGKACLQG